MKNLMVMVVLVLSCLTLTKQASANEVNVTELDTVIFAEYCLMAAENMGDQDLIMDYNHNLTTLKESLSVREVPLGDESWTVAIVRVNNFLDSLGNKQDETLANICNAQLSVLNN